MYWEIKNVIFFTFKKSFVRCFTVENDLDVYVIYFHRDLSISDIFKMEKFCLTNNEITTML